MAQRSKRRNADLNDYFESDGIEKSQQQTNKKFIFQNGQSIDRQNSFRLNADDKGS